MRAGNIFALVGLVLTSGCAIALDEVAAMNAAESGKLDDLYLCNSYARLLGSGRDMNPNISDQVEARGLVCESEIDQFVSDCSEMELEPVGYSWADSDVFEFRITNNGDKPRQYQICAGNNVTPSHAIDAGVTSTVSIGGYFEPGSEGCGAPKLQKCTVPNELFIMLQQTRENNGGVRYGN